MKLVQKREADKSILKYFLPFGYMRRHLARAYGFAVENGDFVRREITGYDVRGFRLADVLPLFAVMAYQRRHHAAAKPQPANANIDELKEELGALRREFSVFRKKTESEMERLSVENMRLKLGLVPQG